MEATVHLSNADSVLIATIDHPPVNALNQATRQALKDAITAFLQNSAYTAMVLTGSERFFSAGADITEFTRAAQPPSLAELMAMIEASDRPIIAAIDGRALGGGLEVALACHKRIGSRTSRFALPEVKLGLLPGAGGTQRLPRLIGPAQALSFISSGDELNAQQALSLGLIDHIAEGDLIQAAIEQSRTAIRANTGARPSQTLNPQATKALDQEADRLLQRYAQQDAVAACVRAVKASVSLSLREGLALERELFVSLETGVQSKAMRHVFFAERQASKYPELEALDVASAATAAILGGGLMGRGIAMSLLDAGLSVTLIDANASAAEEAKRAIEKQYQRSIAKGALTQETLHSRLQRISLSTSVEGVRDADVIIEAVPEVMAIKKDVFQSLGRYAKPGALLATNTSTLDINEIADASGRPGDVIGMHFFSPAHIMKLVEVIRGTKTAPAAIAQALRLSRRMNKIGVVVEVCDGFVGNRMIGKRSQQVDRLLLEGAMPEQIDAAFVRFGFPMGPLTVNDMAGLDVAQKVRQSRGQVFPVADAICALGRYGQKTKAGYYKYSEGSRKPEIDPKISQLIQTVSLQNGISRRVFSDQDIIDRTLLPVINEGFRILQERMATHPDDIDVILVHGYGWPRWRGGPMFYAQQLGLKALSQRLQVLADELNDSSFAPAPLLLDMVNSEKSLHSLARRALWADPAFLQPLSNQ
jgi:3-hydroxyacyl-CoA dehydrogenase